MRKTYLLFASAGVVLLAACGSQSKSAINDDLRKDLELASSDDAMSLGNGAVTSAQQIVSSIERTSPPARSVATSARVVRHKAAPKSPPRVVQTEAPAQTTESEIQTVATAPVAIEPDAPISPRPQPIAVSYPSGESSVGSEGNSRGSATGAVLGTILGAVVRGGVVGDIDHCDERTGRSRGRGSVISVNNRMPFPTGRSGLGRVAIGRSGGNVASRFPH
jgi:hypothetical protein